MTAGVATTVLTPEGEEQLVCERCLERAPEPGNTWCTWCCLNGSDDGEPVNEDFGEAAGR